MGWLLLAPLGLVGSEAAHALVDRLIVDGDDRYELMNRSFVREELLAPALAVGVAMIACAPAARVLDRAARGRRVAALPYVALPIGIYAAQEQIEFGMAAHRIVWSVALEPSFWVGIALQIPFALLAYALARLLTRAVDRLAARLSPPGRRGSSSPWRPLGTMADAARMPALGRGGRSPRGPPAPIG